MAQPTLEGLPVELHISILFTLPDTASVWSLILTSPTYYGAYQRVKKELLSSLLKKHYAGLVDITNAITVIHSRGLYAHDIANKEKIIALLNGRHRSEEIRRLKLSSRPLPDEPADDQELMQLLQLHNHALFFLNDYRRNTEKQRILRAFYRLQIYGNIFGPIEQSADSENNPQNNEWYQQEKTFNNLRSTRSGVIFVSKFPEELRVPPATAILDKDDLVYATDVPEHMASVGPTLLYKILREKRFMAHRDLVLINARRLVYYWCDDEMWPRPDSGDEVYLIEPANRFDFGTDLNGLRKFLETLPPAERPNLAWKRRWLRDDNDFPVVFWDMFEYGGENKHWPWGYAFWDDERIIEWKTPLLADDYPFRDPVHNE
ncbi:uncharacterized protein BO80DRAFT_478376 [Aspergillus ibericus CBS 121593]|uniref:Uncharacterized protein n=1 Tax=Aspergillus ibericus CBS 121593 TaxID=1448316 RepID=A0A395HC75_9EURO|nr:hypothetical protein BO80DRAFT_478376 [Aspergillus ibericus CBS 121593]RAL05392.1 hypothetical protein BO80DRAFT_478376 [Aspergillus ibericus CBS 121593]